ncbi:Gfo/Idh/MocA family oxidoreductase [Candidatus Berkelbacteria bacterium]|nr:Gfo/Idh/MocA family oxidoreductase [Candidatus Berkelbacteria bacterium]
MRDLRVGIIGASGHQGVNHIRTYQILGARITAIADPSPGGPELARQIGCPCFPDHGSLLASDAIDVVSVCVPTALHRSVAVACLEAGKPTLLEKPLAGSSKDAQAILDAEQRTGTFLMVGHSEWFNPTLESLLKLIRSGRIGLPIRLTIERRNRTRSWQRDTDVVVSNGIHDLHWLIRAFGEPCRLDGQLYQVRTNLPDHARIELEFRVDNQPLGVQLTVSWLGPGTRRRIDVLGSAGAASADLDSGEIRYHLYDEEDYHVWLDVRGEKPLTRELRAFLQAAGQSTSPISGSEAFTALSWTMAASRLPITTLAPAGASA